MFARAQLHTLVHTRAHEHIQRRAENLKHVCLCVCVCVCVCVCCSYCENGYRLCPTKCGHTQEEYDAAWDALRAMPLELACKKGYLGPTNVSYMPHKRTQTHITPRPYMHTYTRTRHDAWPPAACFVPRALPWGLQTFSLLF